MSKRIDLTKLGGLLTFQNTLAYMQDAYREPLGALAQYLGSKRVVSGCVDNGVNVTDGFITYNGEIIPFTGGALGATVVITETITQKAFKDGALKDVLFTKTASFGVGGTSFPYSELKRLPFAVESINDFADKVHTILKSIVQFEDEVILEGMNVSNVLSGPSTFDVSAGVVMFEGKIVNAPSFSGAYPAYFKADGGWTNSIPGAGKYITFNPHTSQRYKNVLDRAITPAGRIVMMETLTDRFDAGGVGRWEMKGYELVSALQNRVPVGLWFDGVPVANISAAVNQTAGNTEGGREVNLVKEQIPRLDVVLPATTGPAGVNALNFNGNQNTTVTIQTANATQGVPIVQPVTVVVYAKRVN